MEISETKKNVFASFSIPGERFGEHKQSIFMKNHESDKNLV